MTTVAATTATWPLLPLVSCKKSQCRRQIERLDEGIVATLTKLDICRRDSLRQRVEQHNERDALHVKLVQAQCEWDAQFQSLSMMQNCSNNNKQRRSSSSSSNKTLRPLETSVYRSALTQAFGQRTYLPAFCLTQQATLLRAVHYMMCAEQAVEQCQKLGLAVELRAHSLLVSTQQEEMALTCQSLLSQLVQLDSEIQTYRLDVQQRRERLERLTVILQDEQVDFCHNDANDNDTRNNSNNSGNDSNNNSPLWNETMCKQRTCPVREISLTDSESSSGSSSTSTSTAESSLSD